MIPKIDSEIGISVYTTKFPGCGGIIKKQNDDFTVSEVITEKAHSRICRFWLCRIQTEKKWD